MRINGNQVISNTLVVGPGERAEIDLPIGPVEIEFKSDQGAARVDLVNGRIVFYNMESSLGHGGAPTITLPGSRPIPFRFALYALGEGATALRILHYTVG